MAKQDGHRGVKEHRGTPNADGAPTAVDAGPTETPPTPVADQWRLEKIFPNVSAILSPQPKVTSLLEKCIFMFDTSTLLTPYESDAATIEEIGRVLRPLADRRRLFVPQRALREFANNRGAKITQAATKLMELRQQPINAPPIPFLGNMHTAEPLRNATERLTSAIARYQQTIDELIESIHQLNYDDPISALYRELFSAEQIIKSERTREELEKDFAHRVQFSIPPGYEDKHIGDLVIWHSILDHGERTKQDTVFISNDIKADWAHKIGEKELGRLVAARYELVYEYANRTGGKHYAQLQLGELLRYLKADENAVRAVEASQRAALSQDEESIFKTARDTASSRIRDEIRCRARDQAISELQLARVVLEPREPTPPLLLAQHLHKHVSKAHIYAREAELISSQVRAQFAKLVHEIDHLPLQPAAEVVDVGMKIQRLITKIILYLQLESRKSRPF